MSALSRRVRDFSRWHIERHLLKVFTRHDYPGKVETIGDWLVTPNVLQNQPICYCAGVGENIDFELQLIQRFDARVFSFDPTPRSIKFIERTKPDPQRFTFLPVGLWSKDTTLRFYAPDNPAFVSHSVLGGDLGTGYFDAPCKKISTIMQELGHQQIDLLKMNIEGAEYEVLQSMIDSNLHPKAVCCTFEGDQAFTRARQWIKRLKDYGYSFAGFNRWAATFVCK